MQVFNLAKKGYYIVDGILYYESSDVPDRRKKVVPQHLRQQILDDNHDAIIASHFQLKCWRRNLTCYIIGQGWRVTYIRNVHIVLYVLLSRVKVDDPDRHWRACIPVSGPFEDVGMDFKEMDLSQSGNKYVFVLQEYLTEWPEVYAVKLRQ